jgi:quinol monooxygenase YgiN
MVSRQPRFSPSEIPMICVAVTYQILPGFEDQAIELFRKVTPPTRAEPGCRFYLAHRSLSNPSQFFLYEQYDDQAALDAHRASPHFETYVKNSLFTILDSRSPEIYESLPD